jgi:hypothetical protein
MNTQIATLPETGVSHAKNLGGKLETVSTLKLVAYRPLAALHAVFILADVRFYKARSADGASPVRCTIWVHCRGFSTSGHGVATGYGYHKGSAALAAALESAGITLADDISGRGDSAMANALMCIGHALISRSPVGTYAPDSLTII